MGSAAVSASDGRSNYDDMRHETLRRPVQSDLRRNNHNGPQQIKRAITYCIHCIVIFSVHRDYATVVDIFL